MNKEWLTAEKLDRIRKEQTESEGASGRMIVIKDTAETALAVRGERSIV